MSVALTAGSGPAPGPLSCRGLRSAIRWRQVAHHGGAEPMSMRVMRDQLLPHVLAVGHAVEHAVVEQVFRRWKPSGSFSRMVCSITRGPAKQISAPGSAIWTSPSIA
jgi:hypothetical protein